MTIQCRTGCGQQVSYEQHSFPDGFVYILYTDPNGLPHHCSSIGDEMDWPNFVDDNGNNIIENNYLDFYVDFLLLLMTPENNYGGEEFQLFKQSPLNQERLGVYLEHTKVMANVLPMPFFKTESERDETVYLLTQLSDCYFQLGKFDDSLLALTTQHKITNDQWTHITNLQNKQDVTILTNEKISVNILKDKIQKIEFLIKDYFRTFPIKKIFEFFGEKRYLIEKNHKNQILLDHAKERDEIDGLTLGQCILILYYYRNVSSRKFPEWTASHEPHLDMILQFRNYISAHPNTENIESELTGEEKIAYNVSCKKLLKHLEKINHK